MIIGGTTVDAYLPYKAYQFINGRSTNFVQSTITSNVFTWDNTNYVNTPSAIEQYNTRGIPQLITDNSRIPKTVLSTTVVNSIKVAEFTNAKPENIAFSDFDNAELFTGNFTFGGNAIQAGGRYSGYYLNLQPNTGICRFLDKSPTSKNLRHFILAEGCRRHWFHLFMYFQICLQRRRLLLIPSFHLQEQPTSTTTRFLFPGQVQKLLILILLTWEHLLL